MAKSSAAKEKLEIPKTVILDIIADELAVVEGGWQSLELRKANARHAAEHLVAKLEELGLSVQRIAPSTSG